MTQTETQIAQENIKDLEFDSSYFKRICTEHLSALLRFKEFLKIINKIQLDLTSIDNPKANIVYNNIEQKLSDIQSAIKLYNEEFNRRRRRWKNENIRRKKGRA